VEKSKKIEIKLLRSFGIGFTILSPKYNGFFIEVQVTCVTLSLWNRGEEWIGFNSYWKYD